MKTNFIKTLLTAIGLGIGLNATPTMAGDMQTQAATGCFPRVFSQIDQFKSSSGGLRNTHQNPRTIVCSVHLPDHSDGGLGVEVYPYFETLPAETSCTLYIRSGETGALIDSFTNIMPAGLSGSGGKLNSTELFAEKNNQNEDYAFFQCTLPGNGRIYHYNTYNTEPGA